MGRRLPRRMWHILAALVPLPLIGLGYVAAVPGNPVRFQIELFLAGEGADYALTKAAGSYQPLPAEAAQLFRLAGKGPRADQYQIVKTTTYAGKQLIAASLIGDPGVTSALSGTNAAHPPPKKEPLHP